MKKWLSLVLVVVFIFSIGAIGGYKAALNKLVSRIQPIAGNEKVYAEWTAKYGKSADSLQFYRIAELYAMMNQCVGVINQHSVIINKKADANDVRIVAEDVNSLTMVVYNDLVKRDCIVDANASVIGANKIQREYMIPDEKFIGEHDNGDSLFRRPPR